MLYCSPWNTKPELVVLDRFASISVHVTPQEFLLPLTLFAQRVIDPAAAEVAGQISVHWKPKSLLITAAPAGAPITGHWETIWDAALSASVMRERSVLRNCEVLGFAVLYGFTQLRQPSLIATRRIARLQAERARLRERLEAVC